MGRSFPAWILEGDGHDLLGYPPVQTHAHRAKMLFSTSITVNEKVIRRHQVHKILIPAIHFYNPPASDKYGFMRQQRLANHTTYSRTGQKFASVLGVTCTSASGT